MKAKFIVGIGIVITLFLAMNALAEEFDGVEFPAGDISFADVIVSYNPGSYATEPHLTPSAALGIPDHQGSGDDPETYVSLGNGGILILKFADNSLTTSGNSDLDLWIFEIGPAVEAMEVYISKDGIGWIFVGRVEGSTSGIDIDAYIGNGIISGERYAYVKLVDDEDDSSSHGDTAGADIDAVGAISSDVPVEPECSDSDGDGIPNPCDQCPDTQPGFSVHPNGCAAIKGDVDIKVGSENLRVKAVINTKEKGPVDAIFYNGGETFTDRGDRVIRGYFYADPSDVSWGNQGNPDLYVKIWFDVTGRMDVNFFHVSVPVIDVYSAYPHKESYDQHGMATMGDRYIRHEYQK